MTAAVATTETDNKILEDEKSSAEESGQEEIDDPKKLNVESKQSTGDSKKPSDKDDKPDSDVVGDKRKDTEDNTASNTENKKVKIAMPPAVAPSVMTAEKYELDEPPKESYDDEVVASKITTPNLILFSLHPLIQVSPLKKLCQDYGTVVDISVRSAFASRYGHVEFETLEQARNCYKALQGAKLLHKTILVQPSSAKTTAPAAKVP